MQSRSARRRPACPLAPECGYVLDNVAHRLHVLNGGTEIPGLRKIGFTFPEALRQQQVTAERLQHVLPRASGGRIPNRDSRADAERANAVRDKPVLRPVTSTDNIA